MKKLCLMSLFLVLIVFLVFGQAEDREEIDYLLFLPNSSNLFVNEEQAKVQLDNLAEYLKETELIPGRLWVYGYAAAAVNDIDPMDLSRARALWVVNELQKRGVPYLLFADAVGHGSVDLWGSNEDEDDRIPNRRVRVVLDGNIVTPETLKDSEPEIIIPIIDDEEPFSYEEKTEEKTEKSGSEFPWLLLLLLLILALIAALICFLPKRKKSPAVKTPKPVRVEPVKAEPVKTEPVKTAPAASPVIITKRTLNLNEEICLRAYELYLERGSQNGYADDDWHKAVTEVCARYESAGYRTYFEGEYWWASFQEIKPA